MTNEQKSKILTLAYDLAFELENNMADDSYDHMLENGSSPLLLVASLAELRVSMKSLKTT